MRLSIAIPEAQLLEAPAVLQLIRKAQASDMEAHDEGPAYAAYFDDLAQSVDVVAQLIEESRNPQDIHITIEGRPVVDPVMFYHTLCCYRESRDVPDVVAYCAGQAAKTRVAAACPDRACLGRCQFMCSRCPGLVCNRSTQPNLIQLQEVACQAEVDWCPNLRIGKGDA